jgi:class 3 adenylate cyclase
MGPVRIDAAPERTLEAAREAAERRSWSEAFDTYAALDRERPLDPEDLDRWAKAAWWTGRPKESIAVHERAYAAYLERGDVERAAFAALTLRREHAVRRQGSTAKGWLSRAERLLADRPDSPVTGYLAVAHAELAWQRGELEHALEHVERALAISTGSDDADLQAWALMRKGQILIAAGRIDEGWGLLEEVSVAAVGGELGPYTTGAVFCNVIETSRELADYVRGREFSDAAKRWCERQAIKGFPGICRVRRAEIMRLLGSLDEAASEAEMASEELREFGEFFASEAFHELGEVRLRMGELDAADEAFRHAKGFGADPQPGLALLHLARGQHDAAAASIRRALEDTTWDKLARSRLLPAAVEIGRAGGDLGMVASAAEELEAIAAEFPTPAIRANAELAAGMRDLLAGEARAAAGRFRRARQLWAELDAPYECARSMMALADALEADGDLDAARLELETARDTFFRLGAELDTRAAVERFERLRAAGRATEMRAVRTFVFTDIVSSTALLEAIGDEAWTDLRRWHDEALSASAAAHDGEVIDHTGDGFFLAFAGPAEAVACAIDIQRRLAAHRREHGFAPQVRIGMHAAEATALGENYSGMGVHTAARIGALAGAGEIVASAATVAGLEGLEVSAPREETLKGVAEPVSVVTIAWR